MKILRQAAVLLCLSALLVASWLAPLDAPAIKQVDAGLKRALISFASARAVGAVISVLQGTQIDVMPGGIGATLAPGQALAPINELVKHFSDLMLLASVSFGIQKILISISGYWAISMLLTISAFGSASFYLRKRPSPAWLTKFLVILLMLRFAVPAVTLGTDFLSQQFMEPYYKVSQSAIDAAVGKSSEITLSPAAQQTAPTIAPAAPALPASGALANQWWKPHLPTFSLPTVPDFTARFEKMKVAVGQATEHIVNIMAIFLLQTLVLPIFLLWALYAVAKGVFQMPMQTQKLAISGTKNTDDKDGN